MIFKSLIKHLCNSWKMRSTDNNIDLLKESNFKIYAGNAVVKKNILTYTKHIVCFADVMNYESSIVADKNRFGDTKQLISEVSKLLDSLTEQRWITMINERGEKKIIKINAKFCVSLLFNCMVISYDFSERRDDMLDVFFALREISIVFCELVRNGYFLQGGLAFGDLFHDKQMCIGPAIEKAILCSCKAIYPRIVLDNDFFSEDKKESILLNTSLTDSHYQQIEEIFHCVDVKDIPTEKRQCSIRRNPNFVHYLDYLEIALSEYPEIIYEVKKRIMAGISKTEGEEKKKFLWYAEYFNDVVYARLCYGKDMCINIEE